MSAAGAAAKQNAEPGAATPEAGEAPPHDAVIRSITDALSEYARGLPPDGQAPDTLHKRFAIHISTPLPDLDTANARAYAASDPQEPGSTLYALVCAPELPIRHHLIKPLLELSHPHLITPADAGEALISYPGGMRQTLIYPRPRGRKLSALLAEQGGTLQVPFILERVLNPLATAVAKFEELGLTHGRIHPGNIFIGDSGGVQLGECISEPCGLSQPFYFEPPERIACLPSGKGEGDITNDCYALGMLALVLQVGVQPFTGLDPQAFLRQLLVGGICHTLMGNRDFPPEIRDFMHGTLADHKLDRWHSKQVTQWLGGKRFHVITPTPAIEATRSFTFDGVDYLNCKALAEGIRSKWSDARPIYKDMGLPRWLEAGVRRKDLAEQLIRVIRSAQTLSQANEKGYNDIVARTLIYLDADGPIRMKQVGVHLDGVGTALADLMHRGAQPDIQCLAEIVEHDLNNIWAEMHRRQREDDIGHAMADALWKLDKQRLLLRIPGLGFGLEHCLYDLNPDMPCQSPLVKDHCITALPKLLKTLDRLAAEHANKSTLLDRHIAGFLTSRMGMAREVKLPELERFKGLSTHRGLIALKLFEHAQERTGLTRLPGLAGWVMLGLLPVGEFIHHRDLRKDFYAALARNAENGNLFYTMDLILSPDLFLADQSGFQKAAVRYNQNVKRMEKLRDPRALNQHSALMGRKVAKNIAYFTWLTVLMMTLINQL